MALSGIQIYKLLPQTNCKECGFPTCLAFAMKLAAKQVELATCPYVSEASNAQLAESSAPPIRLISLKSNGYEVKAGNEVVLFRHEKTFYNKPGLFIKVGDDVTSEAIKAKVAQASQYAANYVGMDLSLDGFAVESLSGDATKFAAAVSVVREASKRPLILVSRDPTVVATGLKVIEGETALIYAADESNWEAMTDLAKQYKAALVVSAANLEALADLTQKIKAKGVEDMVLDPASKNLSEALALNTQIRRLAIKKNFRALGYPTIAFPASSVGAVQAIAKYAGFIVLDHFAPELSYPVLVLRENIYTDPQKPIQVQPGLYEINSPKSESPVLVTTNFSITYFSVANEVEGSGLPAWLLVCDAEGMSVLTAWAAGKFVADIIAPYVKKCGIADKVKHKKLIILNGITKTMNCFNNSFFILEWSFYFIS